MANQAPPIWTGSHSTYQKRVITDYVAMLDPSDAPFVEAIGGLDGASSKFKFTATGIKYEWLEDTLSPLSVTAADSASGWTSTTAATTVTLAAGDVNALEPGHILKADSEYLWVSSISGDVITVTRGFGGTTKATHSSAVSIEVIGQARLEGAESVPMGFTDLTSQWNYSQIFHKEIKLTGSAPLVEVYGINDPYEYQAAKSLPEMMRLIEKTLQYGKRAADNTGALTTAPRTMGGVDVFLNSTDSNIYTTGTAAFTTTTIENTLKMAYDDGSSGPFTAIINPTNFQQITAMYNNSSFIRFPPEQGRVGMVPATIVTPFGEVNFVLDRWQKLNYIYFIKPENMGMLTLRPWQIEDLAKGGDYERKELIGEFGFAVKLPKSMAVLQLT